MKRFLQLLSIAVGLTLFATPAMSQQRNYDCSKAGNANKAVCKNAAAAPAAKPAPAARNYDCSKAGNANKAVCKAAAKPAAPTAAPSVAAPAATKVNPPASKAPVATAAKGPNGATAQCNDGTYSQSKTHSGTCSHHGGVKTWY